MVLWGSGFAYLKVYAETLKAVKEGEYGEEWKQLATSEKYVAIDAEDYVYGCKRCGNWKKEKSLSLYVPKDYNFIINRYKLKSIEELEERDCVWTYELREEYKILKERTHFC